METPGAQGGARTPGVGPPEAEVPAPQQQTQAPLQQALPVAGVTGVFLDPQARCRRGRPVGAADGADGHRAAHPPHRGAAAVPPAGRPARKSRFTGIDHAAMLGGAEGEFYLDPMDQRWHAEGALDLVDPKSLGFSEYVVWKFGTYIIDLLVVPCDLCITRTLPPVDYARNAFRRSYVYVPQEQCIYMRRERLESVGDFAIVLVHAMAHIKCEQMHDDGTPEFLAEFHYCLKVLGQELFFAKSKRSQQQQQGPVRPPRSASPHPAPC